MPSLCPQARHSDFFGTRACQLFLYYISTIIRMHPRLDDLIIVTGIIGTALTGIYLYPLHTAFSIFLFIGTTTLIWGSFVEPRLITLQKFSIKLTKKMDREIRIAVLTDLHAGPFKKTNFFERVVQKTIALNPDIVVIVGDHIYNCVYDESEVNYLTPLKKLTEKFPVYATHGNHEYGLPSQLPDNTNKKRFADLSVHVRQTLESYGIRYLVNETELCDINGQRLYVYGADEVWNNTEDYTSLSGRDTTLPLIALIHNPVYLFRPHPTGMDVVLSGHTHGGQFRLPFIGPIVTVDPIVPRKLHQGLHEPERRGEYLIVSRGLGESEPRARLYCPPQIVLLTIK